MDTKTLSERITEKYAWPSGYPMFLVMADSAPMCMNCAEKNEELILRATNDGYEKDWIALGVDVNWGDSDLHCENCNGRIESAYGENDMEPIHIYHIRVHGNGKDFSCHYTGTDGAMKYIQPYLLLGYTVEIYMEA